MLFVGVITVIFVMAAVVIDVGLWLAERRSAQRAADLAAAAGAQDLLVSDSDAVAAAYDWAAKNGYDASAVSAELLCYNDSSSSAICDNPNPSAGPIDCSVGQNCDSLRVTINKPSTMLFSSIFGVDAFDIEAGATAGLTVQSVPTDTVITLDATGSMATTPCDITLSNSGCRMKEARDAANQFVDILLGGLNSESRVGFAAYNHCYNPPLNFGECMPIATRVVALTNAATALHSAISAAQPAWCPTANPPGWCGGTNVCVGLDKAAELLGASTASRKNVVLLTDGEGRMFMPDPGSIPAQCRPPGSIDTRGCTTTETNESGPNGLDRETYDRALSLKGPPLNAEIYVIGLQVCGTDSGSAPNCGAIGTLGESDGIADRRLLKCIASDSSHYVEVTSASQIPDAFREIAGAIISRGLLE